MGKITDKQLLSFVMCIANEVLTDISHGMGYSARDLAEVLMQISNVILNNRTSDVLIKDLSTLSENDKKVLRRMCRNELH